MKTTDLVRAGLRHYWKAHLGVFLAASIGSAVCVGALLVGDSVRDSLRRQAELRIGRVDACLVTGDRFFQDDLGSRVGAALQGAEVPAVLLVNGVAVAAGGAARANEVQVIGVDAGFFRLAPQSAPGSSPNAPPTPGLERGECLLNQRLAETLGVAPGDEILVRVERPSALSRDAALATTDDQVLALRARVGQVLSDESFGRFGLAATQVPPHNLFLARAWLQEELELQGRANVLLLGGLAADGAADGAAERGDAALGRVWGLADVGLEERACAQGACVELHSSHVFLEDPLVTALERSTSAPLVGVLTWFVNSLELAERSTPYSSVTGLGALGSAPAALPEEVRTALAGDIRDGEIVLNEWLATDLDAHVGDPLTLRYFVVGPGGQLVEQSRTLSVRGFVPIEGLAADRTLMPDFPGLSDSENCRDWEPGIPVDLDRIRDEDERYWDEHRGTPKAFVSLATAQEMWGSRFGGLTAVRAPLASGVLSEGLRRALDPASLGLFFTDVRTPALAASSPSTDFGGLFVGLSLFLLVAAFLLTALLFRFGVEQRAPEIGLLLAQGFEPRRVGRLFLGEAALVSLAGVLLGAGLGVAYTAGVLRGLATLWSEAVGGTQLQLFVRGTTLLWGAGIAFLAALGATAVTLRSLLRRDAVELLRGDLELARTRPRRLRLARWIGGLALLAALAIVWSVDTSSGGGAAGAFFGAGAALFVACLAACDLWLGFRTLRRGRRTSSVTGLGVANAARRPGRSLATIGLLASGVFLVVAVGANRLGPAQDAGERASGTGGFELFGRSTLPVLQDLDSVEGRAAFGFDPDELRGVSVVSLRVRDGDDGSCLNLSTPRSPQLVGVEPEALARRGAFRFAQVLDSSELFGAPTESPPSPWSLLDADLGPGVVPAIGDEASVRWTMHKALGDTIEYRDERGRPFVVRLVATLAGSILQGDLVIAEDAFEARFPREGGHRMFLIDTPEGSSAAVAEALGRALSDVGLELTPAPRRLAEFQAVQNTYLSIFQLLGALGVLLGSAGLGTVVLRNTLERRGELGVLRAIGFSRRSIGWLIESEHLLLLFSGVACGVLPALLALSPAAGAAATGGGRGQAVLPLIGLCLGILTLGWFWVGVATSFALRGKLLDALRND